MADASTLAFVTLDDGGDREFSFCRKPVRARCSPSMKYAEGSRYETSFPFGTLSMTGEPAKHHQGGGHAHGEEAGATITTCPNLRRPLWSSMELAGNRCCGACATRMVKIGQDELEFIFEGQDFKDSAKKLVEDFGVKLVFATMGKEGLLFY